MKLQKNHVVLHKVGKVWMALMVMTGLAVGTGVIAGGAAPAPVQAATNGTVTVNYVDGNGVTRGSHDFNTSDSAQDISGYVPTGYRLVGNSYVTMSYPGTTNILVTPTSATNQITVYVDFYDQNGNYIATRSFTGTAGTYADITSLIPSGYYYGSNNGNLTAYLGYTDQGHIRETVTTRSANQVTGNFVFRDANGATIKTVTMTGASNTTFDIRGYLPSGYTLTNPNAYSYYFSSGTVYVNVQPGTSTNTTTFNFIDPNGANLKTIALTGSTGSTFDIRPYLPSGYVLVNSNVTQYGYTANSVNVPVKKESTTNTATFNFIRPDGATVKVMTLTGNINDTFDITPYLPMGYKLADSSKTQYGYATDNVNVAVSPTADNNGLTITPASGVVTIFSANGTHIFNDAAMSSNTGRTLAFGTQWQYNAVVKDQDGTIVGYNVGGSQFVPASAVTTNGNVQKGTFTVRYPANPTWGIAVYNSDLAVQKIIKPGSQWQTFGSQKIDGNTYYNLGGNQWARADYGTWRAAD